MPYKDPEKVRAKNKKWRAANKERLRKKQQLWRSTHKIQSQVISKRYYEKTKNKISIHKKNRYQENPKFYIERARQARIKRFAYYLCQRIKKKAVQYNIPFNLTENDIIVPSTCPILGIPIVIDGHGQRDDCPSIDRFKPENGYVKGNVCIVSMKANRIKNNATIEELELVLNYMRGNNASHT